jgi:hypothetical protein
MTIRLTIKNEDSRENAIVQVYGLSADSGLPMGENAKLLKGGESTEVYIHSGKKYTITEIQNG